MSAGRRHLVPGFILAADGVVELIVGCDGLAVYLHDEVALPQLGIGDIAFLVYLLDIDSLEVVGELIAQLFLNSCKLRFGSHVYELNAYPEASCHEAVLGKLLDNGISLVYGYCKAQTLKVVADVL